MSEIIKKALVQWGWEDKPYRLVAARENAVYQVIINTGPVAMRLHRQGYRTDNELNSELAWMAAIARGGIATPSPIPAINGDTLVNIDEVQVDVLTWLCGTPMADIIDTLDNKHRAQLFHDLGQQMARLHEISDNWQLPPEFERVHWDREGLVGDEPLWDKFWENPELLQEDRDLFVKFRETASAALLEHHKLDYGLIHADLVPANVLVDGNEINIIDFDDGGFGCRLFDIATALLKHHYAEDYAHLQHQLLKGYHAIRKLDISQLDLFMAIRATTYIGWNITRLQEEGGVERNKRFIKNAKRLVTHYLSV